MGEIFYRTYPKKVNSTENTGFLDIYELDQRFILLNILGIKNIVIEDILACKNLYDINPNLGMRLDFFDEIKKANDLGLNVYLRISDNNLSFIKLIEVLSFWESNGIFGFIFDKNLDLRSKILLQEKNLTYITLGKELVLDEFEDAFKKVKDRRLYLKNLVNKVNESKNEAYLSLNKKNAWIYPYVLNFKNFYIESAKIIATINILTKSNSFIREGEELLLYIDRLDKSNRKDLFEFYKKLILIKYDYIDVINGEYLCLYKKDKDLLVYLFKKDKRVLVVMINLSQKDILVNIPDVLVNNVFILGNISKRSIVRTLNLRHFEAIIFESRMKSNCK